MDIPVVEDIFRQVQHVAVCLQVFYGQHGRFFHDITQISGQGKLAALSFAETGFYKQDFTSYGSPGQSGYHTGIFIALILVA